MRTARSSSRRGGGSASVHAGIHTPLGVGLQIPLGVGLQTPQARPLNFPLGCGPGNLQGMVGYHPHPRDLLQGMLGWIPPAVHAGIPPHPL